MQQLCFLYKGDEPGSLQLRDKLEAVAMVHGVRMWSDTQATDPGFANELRDELSRCDVILLCIGPKGIGFYQGINEVDGTFDALQLNPGRRLLIVVMDGAAEPNAFARFDQLPNPKAKLALSSTAIDAAAVLAAALPGVTANENAPEGVRAKELIRKTLIAPRPKCLTIVVGPYAAAEVNEAGNTPERTMAWLLNNRGLPGGLPWLEVMGSLARATENDDEDAAQLIQQAIDNTVHGPGTIEVYLRLVAANWARQKSASRLIIIVCTPDLRVDLALRSSAMPVQHVRLVNCPRLPEGLFAERVDVQNGRAVRTTIDQPALSLRSEDRVVLVKPFGCFEDPANLLISAEHWRDADTSQEMRLPLNLEAEIARSVVLAFGAGALSPSLQIVFRRLLKRALTNIDGHNFRYLVHDGRNKVDDMLHRLERALATEDSKHGEQFEAWLRNVYQLNLARLQPLVLLANFDHQLSRLVA